MTKYNTYLYRAIATLFLSVTLLACPVQAEEDYQPEFPLGLDADLFSVPDENPMSVEKVELGKMLYFDKRLSRDQTVSCATCHAPQKGFTDQLPTSTGIDGQVGGANSPTVINTAFNLFQFWDGRAPSLEEQAKGPIENPIEMGFTHAEAVAAIKTIEGYKPYFEAAFGDSEVTIDRIAQAIATFERTVLSGNSAWDRFVYGNEPDAMSESAKRGLDLFQGKAKCTRCHVGFNLTDNIFHNLGVGMSEPEKHLGRFKVTNEDKDRGAFKTPTLRDIQRTAPYMHDGSVDTLEEVVELYDKGGEANPWLDSKMEPLGLSEQEKADVVAFMRSLEGDWEPTEEPELPV